MLIIAKIGTHPQKRVKVMYKSKSPVKGNHIKIKDLEPYSKPIRCYVEEVREIATGYNLYFLSMM